MSNVLIGAGNATGMFFTAERGTALPSTPGTTPGSAWKEVGAIDVNGISLTLPSGDVIKNWANVAERKINTENGIISGSIMYTNQTVFETLFGAGNVDVAAASSQHGNIASVTLSPDVSAEPAAYLFLVKDGDTLVSIGCTDGLITDIADVSFSPTQAVVWTPSINSADWKISLDDGQTTS